MNHYTHRYENYILILIYNNLKKNNNSIYNANTAIFFCCNDTYNLLQKLTYSTNMNVRRSIAISRFLISFTQKKFVTIAFIESRIFFFGFVKGL